MAMGRDLAKLIGPRPTALMRGHGATVVGRSVRHAVFVSVYLELGAKLQMQAMPMGEIKFLTPGEVDKIAAPRQRLHAQPRLGELGAPRRARDAAGIVAPVRGNMTFAAKLPSPRLFCILRPSTPRRA